MSQRHDGRQPGELRPWIFEKNIAANACGSVLVKCGQTEVICAVSVEESVPRWMKEQQVGGGWITAEYSMLPYSTLERKPRDISKGRLDGRSVEIQRLIGRSMRAVVDLEALGSRTLYIDCDVLRADGGTRTAAITGAYVAMEMAARRLVAEKVCRRSPIKAQIAAVSVGICAGEVLLDLNYLEDRDAAVDMNVVMTSTGQFVEVQSSGEEATFSPGQLQSMLEVASGGLKQLFQLQQKAICQSSAG